MVRLSYWMAATDMALAKFQNARMIIGALTFKVFQLPVKTYPLHGNDSLETNFLSQYDNGRLIDGWMDRYV